MRHLIENHTGNKQYYTKQQVWQWLKAERQWRDKFRQWLRAEGVSKNVLTERRLGRPEQPRYLNRAALRVRKREFMRSLKKLRAA